MHLRDPPPGEALCNLDEFHWRVWGLIHTVLDKADTFSREELDAIYNETDLIKGDVSQWAEKMRCPNKALAYEDNPALYSNRFITLSAGITRWKTLQAFHDRLVSSTVAERGTSG